MYGLTPQDAISRLVQIAADPDQYLQTWKAVNKQKVVGIFPMNFPAEIVAAAGALPVVIQDKQEPITAGNNLLTEFYCGYTRSIADQVAKGQLDIYDGFLNADHCIQLLGAVDVVRELLPEKPLHFEHLIAAMDDRSTHDQVDNKIATFVREVERFTGKSIGEADLKRSIRSANENRRLLRLIFNGRRSGSARYTPGQLQAFVKSSMIMDKDEHSDLLRAMLAEPAADKPRDDRIRLHLSGHFCHAPKVQLFELFEECGAIIVDDDLYHGVRYITTDITEDMPALEALAHWYFERNKDIPCPTRVQHNVDWDGYLLKSVQESGAEGVIVLMAKFCEPHMFYYPELRKSLEAHDIPHLLIETEHEGMPVETIRTRVEAMLERIRRKKLLVPASSQRAGAELQEH